ncbi:hypothetical protein BHE97_00710 [Aeromicrobium sp. PE09-221]|uniref:sulfur carrier protein ThiS n=1 Tax=Aeromicrobium sp. PE09-221 TaxID=1898043 RepID=UPI000B3EBC15|nr:sulfur carrier protein ThiS [Aeromicrobium sp. PE09-221]OUZ12766.1 hypothetical protein BHE97_00710 [Aeromicrobium sp. PE09-221]
MTAGHISIVLDGTPTKVPAGSTLRETIARHIDRELDASSAPIDGGRLGVAVAVDGMVVPRGDWHDHLMVDGAAVDVVTATQGG